MRFLLLILALPLLSNSLRAQADAKPAALYLSQDKGLSWTQFAEGLPADLEARDIVEYQGTIYLSALRYGVFVLTPGASTWQQRSFGLPFSILNAPLFPTSLTRTDDRLILGTFDQGLFVSCNEGMSWERPAKGIPGVISCFLQTDDRLLAGTHAGIWESKDDGNTWENIVQTNFRINALAEHNGQVFVARQNGMGILHEATIQWSDLTTEWAIIQLMHDAEHLYAVTAKEEVFRSKDGAFWHSNRLAMRGLPSTSLVKALWSGYEVRLPDPVPAGMVKPTSRGWLVGRSSGC